MTIQKLVKSCWPCLFLTIIIIVIDENIFHITWKPYDLFNRIDIISCCSSYSKSIIFWTNIKLSGWNAYACYRLRFKSLSNSPIKKIHYIPVFCSANYAYTCLSFYVQSINNKLHLESVRSLNPNHVIKVFIKLSTL